MSPAPALPAAKVLDAFADCRRQSQTGKTGKVKWRNLPSIPPKLAIISETFAENMIKKIICEILFKQLMLTVVNTLNFWMVQIFLALIIGNTVSNEFNFCSFGFANLPAAKGTYFAGAGGKRNYRQNGMYRHHKMFL